MSEDKNKTKDETDGDSDGAVNDNGGEGSADGGGGVVAIEEMDADALRLAYAELRELYLRALAEQQNMRVRRDREAAEGLRFAVTGLARDLLEVDDNLSRALAEMARADKTGAGDGLREGLEMVARGLRDALGRHGVRVFRAEGERLDPHVHEAMAEVESPLPAGYITDVIQEGWMIHDRLLRAARVMVSRGGGGDSDDGKKGDE
ncbi:MAG: nucleotide exchange factor GrpE [Alphaproteobacteria bacterium]|nr:nucleotide exchange factor GrpE [Alphaproteobacteria bacterium]MDA8004909.1 nucleotide exchange factor GrpE [Alphaproteobacteria bacterium]MDA8006572.1 nucleotide exchange factor GrpE [Alphaproteobacteria bacterium]MDA8013984.1 nucleotide exchange factor GrpE [Alphaproteobacteria bacterium]